MSVVEFPSKDRQLVQALYDRGFRLIFYDGKKKGPTLPDWPNLSHKPEEWREGQNVGTFTGHEIAPGKFLVDVDFDWAEGLPLSKHILPPTAFGFGRSSKTISHAFFTTSTPQPTIVFDGLDGKPIVELRGVKNDGTVGFQTMVPPSVHPNGEKIELRGDGEIGHADDLPRRVALYSIACLIFEHLGTHEFLHDVRLSLAGFLLTEGLSTEEVSMIGVAIAEATGNNSDDFKLVVKTTAAKLKSGDKISGKTQLAKSLGARGKDIIGRIKSWIGSSDFIEDAKGKILKDSQENVKIALEKMEITLKFDIFSQRQILTWPAVDYDGPLDDNILRSIWLKADEMYHFRPPKDFFFDVASNIAFGNKFHPVRDYLNSLVWDKIPRIEEWLIISGKAADSPFVRAVSKLMLIAAVRRVTQPGCKFDEMVVLESAQQGLQKSTALRTLCPDEKWFSDDLPLNVDAKQIVERTLGKWIIEASDLSGMQASQVEHLKGMLSRQVDGPVRLAYGRLPVEQPRQFIVTGTTNSYSYLSDSTGNRRFWPVRIQGFDIAWIRENRDQLWAEAAYREAQGESIRLDPALYEHATLQQERRRTEDPWEEAIRIAFTPDKKWRLSPDEFWAPVGISIDRRDTRANDRILKIASALGFRRTTVRTEKGPVKGFARDPLPYSLASRSDTHEE